MITITVLSIMALAGAPRPSCNYLFDPSFTMPLELLTGATFVRSDTIPWRGEVRLKPSVLFGPSIRMGLVVGASYSSPDLEPVFGIQTLVLLRRSPSGSAFEIGVEVDLLPKFLGADPVTDTLFVVVRNGDTTFFVEERGRIPGFSFALAATADLNPSRVIGRLGYDGSRSAFFAEIGVGITLWGQRPQRTEQRATTFAVDEIGLREIAAFYTLQRFSDLLVYDVYEEIRVRCYLVDRLQELEGELRKANTNALLVSLESLGYPEEILVGIASVLSDVSLEANRQGIKDLSPELIAEGIVEGLGASIEFARASRLPGFWGRY